MQRTDRPTFLNFARLRFPVGAVASIGHRISGVLLVCALPFAILALEHSLAGDTAFVPFLEKLQSPAGRIALFVAAWAVAHHLFAGIRHLLMDIGVGSELRPARASAYAVLGAAALIAAAALLA